MLNATVDRRRDGESLSSIVMDICGEKLELKDAKMLIKKGAVRLSGGTVKKDVAVSEGDIAEVYLPDSFAGILPDPKIVYEDENFLMYSKCQGMVTEDDTKDGRSVFSFAYRRMRENREIDHDLMMLPNVCFREDTATGGFVLVSKHYSGYEFVTEGMKSRRIKRFYRVLTAGRPKREEGELHHYIVREKKGWKVSAAPVRDGLPMLTRFRYISGSEDFSVLDVDLLTSRPFQVQAHLAAVGLPIVGDDLFGDKRLNRELGVHEQAIWSTGVVFDTATIDFFGYLDKKRFMIDEGDIRFPSV